MWLSFVSQNSISVRLTASHNMLTSCLHPLSIFIHDFSLNTGCPQQGAQDAHYGGYLLNKTDLPLVCSIGALPPSDPSFFLLQQSHAKLIVDDSHSFSYLCAPCPFRLACLLARCCPLLNPTSSVSALSSLPIPFHTKIRLPSPSSNLTPLSFSLPLIHAGTRTITLHARPVGAPQRRRSAKGLDTSAVGRLKEGLREAGWGEEVRVVGNGGVRVWEDVGRLTKEEGVEGWMVGEGLVGNPRWVILSFR